MHKIYLSVSGHANKQLVREVEAKLATLPVKVLQHRGGRYTKDQLISCDMLLMIPPASNGEDNTGEVYVGMGQYKQMEDFAEWQDDGQMYICQDTGYMNDIIVTQVISHEVYDDTDFAEMYGLAYVETKNLLQKILHEEFEIDMKKESDEDVYMSAAKLTVGVGGQFTSTGVDPVPLNIANYDTKPMLATYLLL